MGLLKHVVLPFYALLSLVVVYTSLVAEDIESMLENWSRDTKAQPITTLEMHLVHAVGGAFAVFFVNNVAAIIVENSHYRGMAVFLQVLFFAVDGYSYVKMGKDVPAIIFVAVGVGLVGLFVHSMEPGIFTKDNKSGKAKNT
eukprot:222051_1